MVIDPAEVIRRQLPYVRKLYAEEAWYEGERRGGYVPHHDPQVRRRVADILLETGAELRRRVEADIAAGHTSNDRCDCPREWR